MKNAEREILYVGKAANLRRRVSSYFLRAHDYRIEKLVSQIKKIDFKKTDTALEALILESKLIKKHQPPFNVLEKDDKSFLYVEITKEKFPRVLLIRGKDKLNQNTSSNLKPKISNLYFGPFTSSSSIREALKIIRRIFPYSIHPTSNIQHPTQKSRACFDFSIGLCPGTCVNSISQRDYAKNIRNIKLFFAGKKCQIKKSLEKEMKSASRKLEFEKAEKLKRQIFALKHIEDTALITEPDILLAKPYTLNPTFRIEGYDISNISGTSAAGSMVVFINDKPDKSQYRKFKIYSVKGQNDTGMIKEIITRRLKHAPPSGEWPLPDLILIDGGRGQVNAVQVVLEKARLKIPIIGIAKGPERKRNDLVYTTAKSGGKMIKIEKKVLVQVRDEAHRFAITYHRELRSRYLDK